MSLQNNTNPSAALDDRHPSTLVALRRAMQLPTLMIAVTSVFSGCVSAIIHDNLEVLPAILCQLLACATQLGSNVLGSYFDLKNNAGGIPDDNGHTWRSTMLPVYRETATSIFIVVLIIGLGIMELSGWWSVILAAFIALLVWMGIGSPLRLLRTPCGIGITFLLFGPVTVIGTSLVQSQCGTPIPFNQFDLFPPLLLSIISGLMAVMSSIIYSYGTYAQDLRDSKRTIVVSYGRKVSRTVFIVITLVVCAMFYTSGILLNFRYMTIDMALPAIWLCVNSWVWWQLGHGKKRNYQLLYETTTLSHLLLWGLTIIMFLIMGPQQYPIDPATNLPYGY